MSSLVDSGNIDKAAIFNVEGTSVWASSKGFEVCQPYIKAASVMMDSGWIYVLAEWLAILMDWPLKYQADTGKQVAPAEIKEVVNSYSDKSAVKKVQSEGFHIAGSRYVTIKADERSLYGRKVRNRLAHPGPYDEC